MTAEQHLRDLHHAFVRVTLRREPDRYTIEAERPLPRDSRWDICRAWAPTAAQAIKTLWENA